MIKAKIHCQVERKTNLRNIYKPTIYCITGAIKTITKIVIKDIHKYYLMNDRKPDSKF